MSAVTKYNLLVGGRYNWRHSPIEPLVYAGHARYPDDGRTWYLFEKVSAPGKVWCEVLEGELHLFEVTTVQD